MPSIGVTSTLISAPDATAAAIVSFTVALSVLAPPRFLTISEHRLNCIPNSALLTKPARGWLGWAWAWSTCGVVRVRVRRGHVQHGRGVGVRRSCAVPRPRVGVGASGDVRACRPRTEHRRQPRAGAAVGLPRTARFSAQPARERPRRQAPSTIRRGGGGHSAAPRRTGEDERGGHPLVEAREAFLGDCLRDAVHHARELAAAPLRLPLGVRTGTLGLVGA